MAEAILTSAGSGPSIAARIKELRLAFLQAVTPDDIVAITRKLIEKACEGCRQCLKLVLSYCIGPPGRLPLGLTMAEELNEPCAEPVAAADRPAAEAALADGATVTKRVVTADAGPEPPALTPEMERFLSQPFSAAELADARRTSVLDHRGKR
jgi:hypothetical protein